MQYINFCCIGHKPSSCHKRRTQIMPYVQWVPMDNEHFEGACEKKVFCATDDVPLSQQVVFRVTRRWAGGGGGSANRGKRGGG